MITITVHDDQVRAELKRIQHNLGDLTPAMAGIAAALRGAVSDRFETKTDPLGNPWAAWRPSTVAGIARDSKTEPGNYTLLDRYGTMLDGLTDANTEDTATVGFEQPYATYHEWGTKHMDRRGLLFADPQAGTLAPDDQARVLDVLRDFLDRA